VTKTSKDQKKKEKEKKLLHKVPSASVRKGSSTFAKRKGEGKRRSPVSLDQKKSRGRIKRSSEKRPDKGTADVQNWTYQGMPS